MRASRNLLGALQTKKKSNRRELGGATLAIIEVTFRTPFAGQWNENATQLRIRACSQSRIVGRDRQGSQEAPRFIAAR